MNRRFLIVVAGLGLALLILPTGWFGGFMPPNARCLKCHREFYAPLGPIYDARCRHAMDGQMARDHFLNPHRQSFLSAYPVNGPVPSILTVIK